MIRVRLPIYCTYSFRTATIFLPHFGAHATRTHARTHADVFRSRRPKTQPLVRSCAHQQQQLQQQARVAHDSGGIFSTVSVDPLGGIHISKVWHLWVAVRVVGLMLRAVGHVRTRDAHTTIAHSRTNEPHRAAMVVAAILYRRAHRMRAICNIMGLILDKA